MGGGVVPAGDREIAVLLNEVKADLNALRDDFRAHDHGATYTAATNRINASANTVSGTETNSAVASASVPEPVAD